MNIFKTTKMNSKTLVIVLLAYFLNNYSAASVKPVKSSLLNGKNTPVHNKNTLVFNQPIQSHPLQPSIASAPTTLPTNGNENHQGFDIADNDDDYVYEYEEESVEEEDGEDGEVDEEEYGEDGGVDEDGKYLENSKTKESPTQNKLSISMKINDSSTNLQPNQSMMSSLVHKSKVPESMNQENYPNQEFETLEEDDGVEEEIEDGHNMDKYSEDQNVVQVNPYVPMNNQIANVPQLLEDKLTENDYDESNYPLIKSHQELQSYERDRESFNSNNNYNDNFETLDKKNDYNKDQLINTNEFGLNSYDNTQISTDKQEENIEDQYDTENNERIIYGYNAIKKILYMLHDYASSIFNLIINKLNYRLEQVSS